MRRPLLIGNWKMHKTSAEARAFAEALGRRSRDLPPNGDYAICAPYTALYVLRTMLPVHVALGAQNVYPETAGAFTGEISMDMLQEFGTKFVIVGHSERRMLLGESNAMIASKVRTVLRAGVTPVLCVGENQTQKEAKHTEQVVVEQLTHGLAELTAGEVAQCVIAYEPVWAIGSGQTPSPTDAAHVISVLRATIATRMGDSVAARARLLYGGSVKPDNLAAFVMQEDIDGALVGGASLDADTFAELAMAMAEGVSS